MIELESTTAWPLAVGKNRRRLVLFLWRRWSDTLLTILICHYYNCVTNYLGLAEACYSYRRTKKGGRRWWWWKERKIYESQGFCSVNALPLDP